VATAHRGSAVLFADSSVSSHGGLRKYFSIGFRAYLQSLKSAASDAATLSGPSDQLDSSRVAGLSKKTKRLKKKKKKKSNKKRQRKKRNSASYPIARLHSERYTGSEGLCLPMPPATLRSSSWYLSNARAGELRKPYAPPQPQHPPTSSPTSSTRPWNLVSPAPKSGNAQTRSIFAMAEGRHLPSDMTAGRNQYRRGKPLKHRRLSLARPAYVGTVRTASAADPQDMYESFAPQ